LANIQNAIFFEVTMPGKEENVTQPGLEQLYPSADGKTPSELYELGIGWAKGDFGRIDSLLAMQLLHRAWQGNHLPAAAALAEVVETDPLYSGDPHTNRMVLEMLNEAARQGERSACFKLATRWINHETFDAARELYEFAARGDSEGKLHTESEIKAATVLGLRHMLGVRVEEDWDMACTYLQRAFAAGDQTGLLHAYLQVAAPALVTMQKLRTPDTRSGTKVREVSYRGRFAAGTWAREIREDAYNVTEEMAERAAAAELLHIFESPYQCYPWNQVLSALDCRLLGAKWEVCWRSHNDFGPMYTEICEEVPRLGVIHPELSEGFGALLGVEAAPDGTLGFQFAAPTSPAGPLLAPEDIDVALALTFGGERPLLPSVSVEKLKSALSGRDRSISEKIWSPPWLGRTLFGKTLYASDHWAGQLMIRGNVYLRWIERANIEITSEGLALLKRLADCGGQFAGSDRVVVYPDAFYRTWSLTENGGMHCAVHKMTVCIGGANIVKREDGTEDRHVNFMDTTFHAGRAATILTTEFDELARLMPMFERTRQLMSLVTALKELRERGFEPGTAIRDNIRKTKADFAYLGPIPLTERLSL
jgi:TPR repeat protein